MASTSGVCQYFLRGSCKFGDGCRFEHPKDRGGFGNQTWTNNRNAGGNKPVVPLFTQESIQRDISHGFEKPMWPLSSYGAAKAEPTLIANLDESPEELRCKAVQALKSGNVQDYQKYEADKIQAAADTFANAVRNISDVFKRAQQMSPNYNNSVQSSTNSVFGKPNAFGTSSVFGASTSTPSAFGNAPASSSSFGKPAFGQSAFGQSAFGQSAFGQPAKPTSAFGQPSQSASAFGQPSQPTSAFVQPAQATSAFGQPTQTTSAFGKPSFGGQPQQTSAFGQTSTPQSSIIKPATAFGASGGGAFSAFAGKNASFGSSGSTPAFGQSGGFGANAGNNANAGMQQSSFGSSQGTVTQSAFAAPAASSSTSTSLQQPSAFGLPAKPVTAFGQAADTQSTSGSVFGQPSQGAPAFGQPSQPGSSFGQGNATAFGQPAASSPFGKPAQPTTSVFGQATQATPVFGQTGQPGSTFGQSAQNTSVFGQSAGGSFGAFGASLPAKPKVGPPDFSAALATVKPDLGRDKHDAILPPDYADQIPESAKEAFASDHFELGKIPEWVPPVQLRG